MRLARVTDIEGIAVANYLAASQEHADIQRVHPCGVVPSEDGSLAYWRLHLAGLINAACVAVGTAGPDEEVVGFALGRVEPLEIAGGHRVDAEIEMLGVIPGHQQHGMGTALLQFVGERLSERRRTASLYAWVWDGNQRARAFYRRLGAEEVASRQRSCEGHGPFTQHALAWEA